MSDTLSAPEPAMTALTMPALTEADLAANERALAFFRERGGDTVATAFDLANILHADRCVAEAALLYRRAYDLHSGQPDELPGRHTLMQACLLCELKAGHLLEQGDLDTLRSLSIPYYHYIIGVQAAWQTGDLTQAARLLGNCYEEFHTGEECDLLCLEIMRRLYQPGMNAGMIETWDQEGAIPPHLFMYRPDGASDAVERNIAWHEQLRGLELRVFGREEAADWLYDVYGVDARSLFLWAPDAAQAEDVLRLHVIQALGGWWLGGGLRLRTEDLFFSRLSLRYAHMFFLTPDNILRNDFFGSRANSPILSDALFSMYRNSYRYDGLPAPYKTGHGVYERALNRTFHADFTRVRRLPSLMIHEAPVFADVLESAPG